MVNIITALYYEAKPIIDFFDLKKIDDIFEIYINDYIYLIISGSSKLKASCASSYILSKNKAPIINIGVCAGKSLGEPYFINKIIDIGSKREYYPDILFKHKLKENFISTYDNPISYELNGLVDMESSGVFVSASMFLKTSEIYFLKVVSDNFSPILEGAKVQSLIKEQLFHIESLVQFLSKKEKFIEDVLLDETISKLKLSKYQRAELKNLLIYASLRGINLDLKVSSNKNETKKELQRIKNLLKN